VCAFLIQRQIRVIPRFHRRGRAGVLAKVQVLNVTRIIAVGVTTTADMTSAVGGLVVDQNTVADGYHASLLVSMLIGSSYDEGVSLRGKPLLHISV